MVTEKVQGPVHKGFAPSYITKDISDEPLNYRNETLSVVTVGPYPRWEGRGISSIAEPEEYKDGK